MEQESTTTSAQEFLTVHQWAKLKKVAPRTAAYWIREGLLPFSLMKKDENGIFQPTDPSIKGRTIRVVSAYTQPPKILRVSTVYEELTKNGVEAAIREIEAAIREYGSIARAFRKAFHHLDICEVSFRRMYNTMCQQSAQAKQ